MDYVDKLSDKVKKLQKLAYDAQHPITIGAKRGVMSGSDSVFIEGQTYSARFASQVPARNGTPVWCQLASNSVAVVVGTAL